VKRRKWAWLLALPAAAALLYLAPARPLAATIQGRLYLAQVAGSHWRQTPVTGHGPGSFEEQFAQWQTEWLQARRQDPGAARFAGAVDHAHNDYLEFLVEYGPAGLAVFLGLGGWIAAQMWRGRARAAGQVQAAAIGAASLLAIAAVDFPFHRPAEWTLFWLFAGILTARQDTNTQGAE
jgi:O-antigen ligase